MTLKIERLAGKENDTVLRVCERVRLESVNTIKELREAETPRSHSSCAYFSK